MIRESFETLLSLYEKEHGENEITFRSLFFFYQELQETNEGCRLLAQAGVTESAMLWYGLELTKGMRT